MKFFRLCILEFMLEINKDCVILLTGITFLVSGVFVVMDFALYGINICICYICYCMYLYVVNLFVILVLY